MDRIEIADLQIDAVVGVLEREQRTVQRLVVDLVLELPLERAGDTGELAASVDYAAIADQVRFIAEHGRFRLVESMALAVLRWVLAEPLPEEARAQVARAEVVIRKPEVLADVCVPGVRLARTAPFGGEPVTSDGVQQTCLVDLPQGGAWRIVLDDGATLHASDRAIYVVAGVVECGGLHRAGSRLPRESAAAARGRAVLLAVGR